MKNNNYKRNRNRSQNRRGGNGNSNGKSNSFDSSGPEIRVRGSAIQVNEKYMTLGNDAYLSGDRIQAESYFQHAEHYYRLFITSNGGIDPRKTQSDNNSELKNESQDTSKNESNSNEKEDSKDSPSKIETISIIDEEKKSSTSQLENNISDK